MADATRSRVLLVMITLVALFWRFFLIFHFYGWEESDYGNLAMTRGVLDSAFTRYDMNHLPLYYGLSAMVTVVTGSTVVGTRVVSMAGGFFVLLLTAAICMRIKGVGLALLAVCLLLFQPELALYSASALREPLYAALLLAVLYLLGQDRLSWASLLAGLAFLVRFEALWVLGLVLALSASLGRPRHTRLLRSMVPLMSTVLLWSAYCKAFFGTWRFWQHSVQINLETGGGQEIQTTVEWSRNGLEIVWGLLTQVLPGHMGTVMVLAALAGVPMLVGSRAVSCWVTGAAWFTVTGFWLLIGFLAQHYVGHNLYWKWMLPIVPLWAMAAALAMDSLWRRARRLVGGSAATAIVVVLVAWTWMDQLTETKRQIELSRELYLPQLSLARRIERNISPEVPLLLDNIPGCWLNRRHNDYTLFTWMDLPVAPGDRTAFGEWLERKRVGYVLWFREEWTTAPIIAPWLQQGGYQQAGSIWLEELDREDAYGWIWYKVHL